MEENKLLKKPKAGEFGQLWNSEVREKCSQGVHLCGERDGWAFCVRPNNVCHVILEKYLAYTGTAD